MLGVAVQLVNMVALLGWLLLFVHAILPDGLIQGTGKGLQCADARLVFAVVQGYCAVEVLVIGGHRHLVKGSTKGLAQTILGMCICLFRVTVTIFVLPLVVDGNVHRVLLGGWAFSDVIRYLSLLGKNVRALQLLRRSVSGLFFLVIPLAEVYASHLVVDQLTGGVQTFMRAQMLVTVLGFPVGTYIFIAAAFTKKSSKAKKV